MRSQQNVLMQREQVRRYPGALLRRNGLHYKAETQARTHWTKQHYGSLERTIKAQSGSLKVTLELLNRQLQGINQTIADYNQMNAP